LNNNRHHLDTRPERSVPPDYAAELRTIEQQQSDNHREVISRLERIERQLPQHRPVQSVELTPEAILEECVTLVAKGNEPLSRFNDRYFLAFLNRLCPGGEFPISPQIRSAILRRADEIRAAITPETEGGAYVSLMSDGARDAGRIWFGICLSTARNLHFWRVVSEPNQKAVTIASSLSTTVMELRKKGFVVMSVVTDNASNEKCALRPDWSLAVQNQTGAPLFRTPCLSHTVNLGIQTFLGNYFPPQVDVWSDMATLENDLLHSLKFQPFSGIPKIIKTS
jgi:hypothetical protein